MLVDRRGRDAAAASTLPERLGRAGEARSAGGNAPFLVDAPARACFVASGRVDLFLVELREGRPRGSRTYLATFEAGSLLFGVDGEGGLGSVGLLAVATVGTVLVDLALGRVQDLAREPGCGDAMAELVERWITALSEAAAAAAPPPPAVQRPVAPGDDVEVVADERVTAHGGLGWMALDGRGALFLDSADIPDAVLFPIIPGTWATIGRPGPVRCRGTGHALAHLQAWAGLQAFHAAIVEVLPLLLRLAAVDEANRLKRRASDEARDVEAAEAALATVVVKLPDRPVRTTDDDDDLDDLVAALGVVAREMKVALKVPVRHDGEPAPTLETILRASNLRARQVMLDAGWWREDVGSVLLLEGPGGGPAALQRRGRRIVLVERDGVPRRLGRSAAARLAGPAFVLYEPLPDVPLTSAYLVRRVWQVGRSEIRAIVAFSAIAGVLSLLLPLVTGYLADDVIPSRDVPGLVEVAVILTSVVGLQFVLRLAAGRAMQRLEGTAGSRLQAAIMDRVLRLPAGYFRDASAGEISQRIMSLKGSIDGITNAAMGGLIGGSSLLSSLAVMFYASPKLATPGLGLVLVLTLVAATLGTRRHRHEKDLVRNRGRLSGRVLEMMNGVVKLRLAAAENRAFARWAEIYGRFARSADGAKRVDLTVGLTLGAFVILSQAVLFLLVYQSGAVEAGLGLGLLVTFLTAFNQAIGAAAAVMGSALSIVALKPSFQHASPILAGTPERSSGSVDPGPLSGAIEIGGVHFAYGPTAPPVLSELSLQIEAGEFVALVGPSGSGKSTIVRLLLGFETPSRGAILYDSKDLRSLDLGAVRRQMGVVLQRGRLFGASVEENILGANLHLGQDAAWRAAEEAGIADDIRAMPMGMLTVYVEGGLSGGQVQRILLARALVHRPKILLLDEATSALDNRTQALVTETLGRLSATRIVIAHRLSTVMSADRILVIKDGAVAESGTYADLLAAGGAFSEIASRQLA